MEKQLKNRNRSDSDGDKSNSETPSCDLTKDESQMKTTSSEDSATTSLNFDFLGKVSRNMKEVPDKTSRKRKKSVTEKSLVKKSKNVELELEEEIKCIEVVQKREIEIKKPLEEFETIKKTKAELRDTILSCLYKNSPESQVTEDKEVVIELVMKIQRIILNRADTLVRFAAGSPENGLFCQNGPFLVCFYLQKSFFIHGICMYNIPLESSA